MNKSLNACLRHAAWVMVVALHAGGAQAATAAGAVKDASGQPVSGATVLVHSAGVRKGYSTFCPTCYVDCGKRATTDAQGNFTIPGLDDELVFSLIVLQDAHTPAWIRGFDPQKGVAATAVLRPRPATANPDRRVLGRLVDTTGRGVPDAVVEVVGVADTGGGQSFSSFPDGLAVSDREGWFELPGDMQFPRARTAPSSALMLEIKPRGMAQALYSAAIGPQPHQVTISDGVTVHGRLMARGKPVTNAQLILLTLYRASGQTFSPLYIGTDDKGRFAITNVPTGRVWSLDANSDSLAGIGAVETRYVATPREGVTVDVGDLQVKPGFTLAGRVVLSNGAAIPPDMRIYAGTSQGGGRTVTLQPDGRFEFRSIAGALILTPQVRGYRTRHGYPSEVLVDRDVTDLVITLDPQPVPAAGPVPPLAVQPAN